VPILQLTRQLFPHGTRLELTAVGVEVDLDSRVVDGLQLPERLVAVAAAQAVVALRDQQAVAEWDDVEHALLRCAPKHGPSLELSDVRGESSVALVGEHFTGEAVSHNDNYYKLFGLSYL
jgi:hypothetical protein